MKRYAPCLGLVLLTAVSAPAFAANTVHFAAHRAVYDISLARAASGSGVSGMTGRMVYELTGSACEGFTQNMRFVTRMSNQEGGETVNDLRNSSWEEAAGKRLRFSTTQFANEEAVESSQGDVRRADPAAAANVDLVKPEKSQFALPANTYFPMQHAEALIKAARDGKTLLAASVYDGSEKGTKIYLTNAVIGKAGQAGGRKDLASLQDAGKDAGRMAALQSWPMSLSYFESGKDKQDAPPAYELSYNFYENGVTAGLAIDYGEFAIKGDLKELTFLPESPCAAPEH